MARSALVTYQAAVSGYEGDGKQRRLRVCDAEDAGGGLVCSEGVCSVTDAVKAAAPEPGDLVRFRAEVGRKGNEIRFAYVTEMEVIDWSTGKVLRPEPATRFRDFRLDGVERLMDQVRDDLEDGYTDDVLQGLMRLRSNMARRANGSEGAFREVFEYARSVANQAVEDMLAGYTADVREDLDVIASTLSELC